jgi:hypothetical protein
VKYIEFRVYLKDGVDTKDLLNAADILLDDLTDLVSADNAPDIFTQDVSYEVKVSLKLPEEMN